MNRLFKVIPFLALLSLSCFVSAQAADDQQYAVKKTTKLTPEQLAQLAAPAGNITTPGVKQGVQPLPPHTAPQATPIPGGTSAVVDSRPSNVPPDRNFMCPAGYYCIAKNNGFLPTCILGAQPDAGQNTPDSNTARDCNKIAYECNRFREAQITSGQFYDQYCK